MKLEEGYSFCEAWRAATLSRWHIRTLTDAGIKIMGGTDTPSLCERGMSWDVTPRAMDRDSVCSTCVKVYEAQKEEKTL